MSLWKIAWRSIQQRALSSALTGVSMALGVALVVSVLVISTLIRQQFSEGAQGYHLIVGAKGGKLQLVLNTVYHLSQPIENIPWHYYKEFLPGGQFGTATAVAIPYCLGDSWQHKPTGHVYRVVGTTPDLFEKIDYGRNSDGTPRKYQFQQGRNIQTPNFVEAVIGATVARQTGLKVGDTFRPAHGVVEEGVESHEHDPFTIVGVLAPTGTPNDRALFINIEGFFLLKGHAKGPSSKENHAGDELAGDDEDHHEKAEDLHHDGKHEDAADHENDTKHQDAANHDHDADYDHDTDDDHDAHHDEDGHDGHDRHEHEHGHDHHHEPLPEDQREVTAVLVLAAGSGAFADLNAQDILKRVNKDVYAQAVTPSREITLLFDELVGPVEILLLALTGMIVLVAGIGIMVAIYNSMNERRHEIAIMRALGAGRSTVMLVVLLESVLLSLVGGVAGVLLGHGLIGLIRPIVAERTGVIVPFLQFEAKELILIPGLVVLASLVGYLPSLAAYRTDVAKALTNNP